MTKHRTLATLRRWMAVWAMLALVLAVLAPAYAVVPGGGASDHCAAFDAGTDGSGAPHAVHCAFCVLHCQSGWVPATADAVVLRRLSAVRVALLPGAAGLGPVHRAFASAYPRAPPAVA